MSLYVDSSVLLTIYLKEPRSESAKSLLFWNKAHFTAQLTEVEVRRNLSTSLKGNALIEARGIFQSDWETFNRIELTERVCGRAALIAEETGVRSLDAIHLGAAYEAGSDGELDFVTFDKKQSDLAKNLGWRVWGINGLPPGVG